MITSYWFQRLLIYRKVQADKEYFWEKKILFDPKVQKIAWKVLLY